MGDQPDHAPPDPAQYSRLVRDLTGLADTGIDVPRQVDETVLRAAEHALRSPRPRTLTLRYAIAAGAAAAVVIVTVWLAIPPRPAAETSTAAAADVDRSGRVDILDAFALARRLESGVAPGRTDMNGDGIVDRTDVDTIAMLAVTLAEGAS